MEILTDLFIFVVFQFWIWLFRFFPIFLIFLIILFLMLILGRNFRKKQKKGGIDGKKNHKG